MSLVRSSVVGMVRLDPVANGVTNSAEALKECARHHLHHRLEFPGRIPRPSSLFRAAMVDWCSAMMRLCLSNSLSPCFQSFPTPTPWLISPSQRTHPATAGPPLSTVLWGRHSALIEGGIGWRGRAGGSCQRSAYGGRRRDQCRGRKRRREDHGHRWHRSHTWWYSKRN